MQKAVSLLRMATGRFHRPILHNLVSLKIHPPASLFWNSALTFELGLAFQGVGTPSCAVSQVRFTAPRQIRCRGGRLSPSHVACIRLTGKACFRLSFLVYYCGSLLRDHYLSYSFVLILRYQ